MKQDILTGPLQTFHPRSKEHQAQVVWPRFKTKTNTSCHYTLTSLSIESRAICTGHPSNANMANHRMEEHEPWGRPRSHATCCTCHTHNMHTTHPNTYTHTNTHATDTQHTHGHDTQHTPSHNSHHTRFSTITHNDHTITTSTATPPSHLKHPVSITTLPKTHQQKIALENRSLPISATFWRQSHPDTAKRSSRM